MAVRMVKAGSIVPAALQWVSPNMYMPNFQAILNLLIYWVEPAENQSSGVERVESRVSWTGSLYPSCPGSAAWAIVAWAQAMMNRWPEPPPMSWPFRCWEVLLMKAKMTQATNISTLQHALHGVHSGR